MEKRRRRDEGAGLQKGREGRIDEIKGMREEGGGMREVE